jgi:hypothetical protein
MNTSAANAKTIIPKFLSNRPPSDLKTTGLAAVVKVVKVVTLVLEVTVVKHEVDAPVTKFVTAVFIVLVV